MRRTTFILIFVALFINATSFSQVPSYVPTNGLVGWWPFNGNANDESGNGNNGTVNGATLTMDRFGNANKAYSFDGVDDFIDFVNSSVPAGVSSRTISLWFYVLSYPQDQQGYYFYSQGITTIANSGQSHNLVLIRNNSNPTAGPIYLAYNASHSTEIQANFQPVISNWYHLVGVYEQGLAKLFLNSNLLSQLSVPFWNTANNNFVIGRRADPDDYCEGKIDDIGIWNRALTQQEITNLYNAGPFSATASNTAICDGQSTTLSVNALSGTVSALNCSTATNNGYLVATMPATNANSVISYTGGNGGFYDGQIVSSTGVTGLTATLNAGTLASGDGTLTYTITGTPSASGTASFALNIGGQTCTLTCTVQPLSVLYPANSVFCASGPSTIVDVTNPTTGKVWMDRNLGATQAAISATDAAAYGDLYQWGRRSDGHQCRTSTVTSTLSSTDQPADGKFIIMNLTPFDWRSPQNDNLWQGVTGINNPCPIGYRLPTETELNDERLSWSTQNGAGGYAAPLKWTIGGRRNYSNGALANATSAYYWTSTINGTASRSMTYTSSAAPSWNLQLRGYGISVRCIKEVVGTIGAIDCGGANITGNNLVINTAASGVNVTVPYTGGNAGGHIGQTVTSTGVTGLTATLAPGSFANGGGNLTYTITGTPSTSGTASFALNIGGKICSLNVPVYGPQPAYPTGTVDCNSVVTIVNDVTNPATGKTWMDRNLGASQVAKSSTDALSYGDLYQWGRGADGHQCRNSATTSTLSTMDQPGHGNFILSLNTPYDWRNPQNTNLWQGVIGVNNPCPNGYRLPTENEMNSELLSWSIQNSTGAFVSPLKWTVGGARNYNGIINDAGLNGFYFSSSLTTSPTTSSRALVFGFPVPGMYGHFRGQGLSVRCIKD